MNEERKPWEASENSDYLKKLFGSQTIKDLQESYMKLLKSFGEGLQTEKPNLEDEENEGFEAFTNPRNTYNEWFTLADYTKETGDKWGMADAVYVRDSDDESKKWYVFTLEKVAELLPKYPHGLEVICATTHCPPKDLPQQIRITKILSD
jgi:hypothetical protein